MPSLSLPLQPIRFLLFLWLGELWRAVVQSWSNISASFYQWDYLILLAVQNLKCLSCGWYLSCGSLSEGKWYWYIGCCYLWFLFPRLLFILLVESYGSKSRLPILNGMIMGLLCLSGTVAMLAYFVPVEAGMAIVLWIVIVAQKLYSQLVTPCTCCGYWSITRHCWLGCANC